MKLSKLSRRVRSVSVLFISSLKLPYGMHHWADLMIPDIANKNSQKIANQFLGLHLLLQENLSLKL